MSKKLPPPQTIHPATIAIWIMLAILLLIFNGCSATNPLKSFIINNEGAAKITSIEDINPHRYRRGMSVAVSMDKDYSKGYIIDIFDHTEYQWAMYNVWHLDGSPYQVLIKKAPGYCLAGMIWGSKVLRSASACRAIDDIEYFLSVAMQRKAQPHPLESINIR